MGKFLDRFNPKIYMMKKRREPTSRNPNPTTNPLPLILEPQLTPIAMLTQDGKDKLPAA